MNHFQFFQQVKIKDQVFKVGVHEVAPELQEHPDFLHFAECGWIAEAEPAKVAAQPPATASEQAAKLAKKIKAKLSKKAAEAEQVREPVQSNSQPETADSQPTEPNSQHPVEDAEDDGGDLEEEKLTPQQKAARTRKANAAKKAAEKGE